MKNNPQKTSQDVSKRNSVREALAEILGVEVEDINTDDSLQHDLHLKPTDLSDLTVKLSDLGHDVTKIDLGEVDTVGDIEEALELEI